MHDNSIPNSAHIVKKKYRRSANWDITLRCGTVLALSDVEDAGLSYVPCGQIEGKDQPLLAYSHLWDIRRQVMLESYHKVSAWTLPNMTGVQLMTGLPSYRPSENSPTGYIHLADIDIERKLIDAHPDIVDGIVDVYRSYCDRTPCIVETKSGGRRLSAFSDYLDPKREYHAGDGDMLMEMFSLKGLSRLDHRYAILEGSIFDLPIIPKTALQEIHAIISEVATHKQHSKRDRGVVETSQISGLDLHWDASGRSQYFSTSHCQATSHKNTSRDTVQFLKIRDGVMGKCYNCGESWWEVELTPLLPVGIEPVKALPTDHPLLANAPEHEDIYAKQHKAKLQRTTEDAPEPTETLDENRATRAAATDRFMETDETDTLHILLIKEGTGTGKSHTVIAKTHQHGKRTLAQVPHTELATQAVDLAFLLGYKDPFHLLGREHNWDASRIELIPVEMRTKALFDKNNCIMVDQVRAYTDQRLAPRTYCEHKCPFRDGCLHLAQYEGLGHRDFLVSCTPNLLFDLDMRGYLQSLVTATAAPSGEELAIDAMWGTESEPTILFDFAILDDYSIDGLYSDKAFKQSEFKALQKSWSGTPTARFASLVLKAFKKKKPAKIVKALRKAFENTEEDHVEIAIALTQHARLGVLEYVERPKASEESRRVLSETQVIYDDGGRHFVAVDDEAYTELREKNIPVVKPEKLSTHVIGERVRVPHAPVHALMAGVPLNDFTVWRGGTTPIELLDIFLSSVGNDKNAPIARTFLVGSKASEDPPDALLTFSLPPQAPVGILPQIALLSATTDTNDTQRAFDGQDVTFSEHTGGDLEWAAGVQVYQYTDARLTSASMFQYPLDADGKRKLQEQPIGLTPTAEKRLEKLNGWAKEAEGLTAFISYKEFTETGTPLAETVNAFDIVTHFDKVAGLNFDGLKFLVVFGYPKVKHEVVMEQARKQYASDSEPLPKVDPTLRDDNGKPISEYEQLTEDITVTENGMTITERRYKEPRLEKIRHQLATEKIDQAIGRARLPVWADTRTLIFTDAPIGNITERATLFSSAAFNLAETPDGLAEAMDRIAEVEDSGDVKEVMETKQVSERTARRQTQQTRQQTKAERNAEIVRRYAGGAGETQQEIADALGIGLATVNRVLKA